MCIILNRCKMNITYPESRELSIALAFFILIVADLKFGKAYYWMKKDSFFSYADDRNKFLAIVFAKFIIVVAIVLKVVLFDI